MKRFIIATAVAAVITSSGFVSHSQNVERKDADFVTEYLQPTRIVWETGVENSSALLRPYAGQAALQERNVMVMKKGSAVLVDFGKEIQGRVQIVRSLSGGGPINVRVRMGESVAEAMSDVHAEGSTATNDHAMRDLHIEVPSLGVAETNRSGFRFARIDVEDDVVLNVVALRAVSEYRDLPYLGTFNCSDDRLNQIWKTGAYTVQLNMQEYVWDGIKRDRLVWIGDMHPEVTTITTVFGEQPVVKKSLDFIRDITPADQWMNGYITYSMWWLLIQRDHYRYTGNLEYLKEQHDYISKLLDHIMENIDGNKEAFKGGVRFVDWPTADKRDVIHAGMQCVALMSMEAGAEIARLLGDKQMGSKCAETASRLKTYTPDSKGNKQAASLLSLSGLMDPQACADIIMKDGPNGFSTFFGYYMLEALAKAGKYEEAMDIMSKYWGAMLDLGATTFWEDLEYSQVAKASRIDELVPEGAYDMHGDGGAYCYVGYRHSYCHGWASGPTSWLSHHVLGVYPVEPGYKTVCIEPHLGNLSWAEGTVATPYGQIKVSHKKGADGKVATTVELPKGVKRVK
ncbi:MAG: alpha-L-rhamnosidase [Bacteroidales bacterium]|nr:alpha-L-rhamnosidase [Bacteroidales bacterium]